MNYNIEKEIFECDRFADVYIAMRIVKWGNGKPKLDLRKWKDSEDDKPIPLKGFSFQTEDGPDELALSLIKAGYGDTEEIKQALIDRGEEIKEESNEIMYDPKQCLF